MNNTEEIVRALCKYSKGRHHQVFGSLRHARSVIRKHFNSAGVNIESETWKIDGHIRENITGSLATGNESRIIVCAHYDTVHGSPGADDNASSVAVLLRLASILSKETNLSHRIDLVALDTEEPPFFLTPAMGSYWNSDKYEKMDAKVSLVIVLEMLGYYSDQPCVAEGLVPPDLLSLFNRAHPGIPNPEAASPDPDQEKLRGDFLSSLWVAGDTNAQLFSKLLEKNSVFPFLGSALQDDITPMHYCDAWCYMNACFPVLLISDTGMIRNPHYHTHSDTPDTLDYSKIEAFAETLAVSIAAFRPASER
jgi:Zn-dependent M28 family amino/carboxypeptidase